MGDTGLTWVMTASGGVPDVAIGTGRCVLLPAPAVYHAELDDE